jgi:hypothetical protein
LLVSLRYLCSTIETEVDTAIKFWAPLVESCTGETLPHLQLAHLVAGNDSSGRPKTVAHLRRGWNWVYGDDGADNPFGLPDVVCKERNAPEELIAFLEAFPQP